MYAIVQVGGKQYKVSKGDTIEVEKMIAKKGKAITLDQVLLVKDKKDVKIGQPHVKDAKVTAEAVGDLKAKKVVSFKYRRRKSSRWKKGHRQQLTRLEIKDIVSK